MACCEPTERWLRTELRTTLVLRSSPVGPGFSAALAAHGRRDRASQTLSALFAARASPTEQPRFADLGGLYSPQISHGHGRKISRGAALRWMAAAQRSSQRSEKCGKGRQFDSRSSFCHFGRLSAAVWVWLLVGWARLVPSSGAFCQVLALGLLAQKLLVGLWLRLRPCARRALRDAVAASARGALPSEQRTAASATAAAPAAAAARVLHGHARVPGLALPRDTLSELLSRAREPHREPNQVLRRRRRPVSIGLVSSSPSLSGQLCRLVSGLSLSHAASLLTVRRRAWATRTQTKNAKVAAGR